jgi:Na+/proline symporter
LLAVRYGSILELIVKVNSYFYGCLLGVFLLGMASKRVNSQGAFMGLLTSMVAILVCAYFRPGYWVWFGAVGCTVCMSVGYAFSYVRFDRQPGT